MSMDQSDASITNQSFTNTASGHGGKQRNHYDHSDETSTDITMGSDTSQFGPSSQSTNREISQSGTNSSNPPAHPPKSQRHLAPSAFGRYKQRHGSNNGNGNGNGGSHGGSVGSSSQGGGKYRDEKDFHASFASMGGGFGDLDMGQSGANNKKHGSLKSSKQHTHGSANRNGNTSSNNNGNNSGTGHNDEEIEETKDNEFDPNNRTVGDYRLGETVGVGGYSKVKMGWHVKTNQPVALKIMFSMNGKKSDEKTRLHLIREISVMQTVIHDNVLKLLDFYDNADYPETNGKTRPCAVTVLEYAPCGELFDYLMFTGPFGDLATRTYTHQMMEGLHAMHKQGIAHRDLKPENLLLDAKFQLKIADFGFARSFVNDQDIILRMHTTCGTKGYLAPEVLGKKPYTYKADLFTMGIIIFTTYCAFPPFQNAEETDWWWKRLSRGINYLERSKKYGANSPDPAKQKQYTLQGIKCLTQFWENHTKRLKIDQEFQELMINMLHPSPERRFNHQQIRNHKWYKQRIMSQAEVFEYMRSRVDKVTKNRRVKVNQMVKDRLDKACGGYDPNNNQGGGAKRATAEGTTEEKLQQGLRTELHYCLADSRLVPIMNTIDPNMLFLDNIEYETDMPQAGIRHSFCTKRDPIEIAARFHVATLEMGSIVNTTAAKQAAPVPSDASQYVIITASMEAYPQRNVSFINFCVNLNGVQKQELAIRVKQYVRRGTRFTLSRKQRQYMLWQRQKYLKRKHSSSEDTGDSGNEKEDDGYGTPSNVDEEVPLDLQIDTDEEDAMSDGDGRKERNGDTSKVSNNTSTDATLTDTTLNDSTSPPPSYSSTDKQMSTSNESTTSPSQRRHNNKRKKAKGKAPNNEWVVVISKVRGSLYAYETVVADLLACNEIYTAMIAEKEPIDAAAQDVTAHA